MVRKLLYSILFCSAPFITSAQQVGKYSKRSIEEKARFYTKEMIDKLELSAVQEEACYEINVEVSRQFDQLYKDTILNAEERRPIFRSIFQYRDSSLRKTLDRKQFLKFLDDEMEKRERKKKN